MKPRYEIHSIGMPEIVEPVAASQGGTARPCGARTVFGDRDGEHQQVRDGSGPHRAADEIRSIRPALSGRIFVKQVDELSGSLSRAWKANPEGGDLTKVMDSLRNPAGWSVRDAWNTKLRLEPRHGSTSYYMVRSAGPDKRFDTADDLNTYVSVRQWTTCRPTRRRDHRSRDRTRSRPFNGRAEIAGSV